MNGNTGLRAPAGPGKPRTERDFRMAGWNPCLEEDLGRDFRPAGQFRVGKITLVNFWSNAISTSVIFIYRTCVFFHSPISINDGGANRVSVSDYSDYDGGTRVVMLAWILCGTVGSTRKKNSCWMIHSPAWITACYLVYLLVILLFYFSKPKSS